MIACLTVIVPVVAFLVRRAQVAGPLERARVWLISNNDTIISVVFVAIGVLLIVGGVADL